MARSRSCSHWGLGPFFTLRTIRPQNSGQALAALRRKLEMNAHGSREAAGNGSDRAILQTPETGGSQIARNAIDAGAIAAIGRQRNIDHRIVEVECGGSGGANGRVGGQLDDPVMFVGQEQLAHRAQHAARFDAANGRDFERFAGGGNDGARFGEDRLHAGMRVGRTANDLHDVVARIDHAQLEFVGIGMFFGRHDMGDGEFLQRARPCLRFPQPRARCGSACRRWSSHPRRYRDVP